MLNELLAGFLVLALQPQETKALDPSALKILVEAREESLSSFAWDFEVHFLNSDGVRVGPDGELDGPPMAEGRLITGGTARRLQWREEKYRLDVTAIWDGEQARARYVPVQSTAAGSVEGPAFFEEGASMGRYFGKTYLPESFGIGFVFSPLSRWLHGGYRLEDLGYEDVNGVRCRKLLMRWDLTRLGVGAYPPLIPPGLWWIDEDDSWLVYRAQTFVLAEEATEATPEEDLLEVAGRTYAPLGTWDVLETTRVGKLRLPTRGRFSFRVPGELTSYEVDLRPEAPPPGGWPESTFELPYDEGAIIRDVRTGKRRVHRPD